MAMASSSNRMIFVVTAVSLFSALRVSAFSNVPIRKSTSQSTLIMSGSFSLLQNLTNPFAQKSESSSSSSASSSKDSNAPLVFGGGFRATPEALVARAKLVLASDLGVQDESLLDEESFVWIGPSLGSKVLGKADYLAAGKFFDLRTAFPDLDFRAHDFRIDAQDPLTIRLTARTVGSMRGELRLRNEILIPTGKRLRCPPEAISMTFDEESGKLVKLCSGFTMDRLVGNTLGLCGAMGAAVIGGAAPSDFEIYPATAAVARWIGRPVKQLEEPESFLAPFPETVMIQLAKGIIAANMAADDAELLGNSFTFCTPNDGPVNKRIYIEKYASSVFGEGREPVLSHFRVDPYDPYRVWVDVKPFAPGYEGAPQAASFTFDDDGFCNRLTAWAVMDPSIGNGGGLGGSAGSKYATGSALPGVTSRPFSQVLSRVQQNVFEPITKIGVDEYTNKKEEKLFHEDSDEEVDVKPNFSFASVLPALAPKVSAPARQTATERSAPIQSASDPKARANLAAENRAVVDAEAAANRANVQAAIMARRAQAAEDAVEKKALAKDAAATQRKKIQNSAAAKKVETKAQKAQEVAANAKKKQAEASKMASKQQLEEAALARKVLVQAAAAKRKANSDAAATTKKEFLEAAAVKRKAKSEAVRAKALEKMEGSKERYPVFSFFESETKDESKLPAKSYTKRVQKTKPPARTVTPKIKEEKKTARNQNAPAPAPFLFFGSKKQTNAERISAAKAKPMKATVGVSVAPKGIPILTKWQKNRNGSITGLVQGSNAFSNGETITTSEIESVDIRAGKIVITGSGSKYFLDGGKRETKPLPARTSTQKVKETKAPGRSITQEKVQNTKTPARSFTQKMNEQSAPALVPFSFFGPKKQTKAALVTKKETRPLARSFTQKVNEQSAPASFPFFGSEKETKANPVSAAKGSDAPKGLPALEKWQKNRDGSITGLVQGSDTFANGEKITTSEIESGDVSAGNVVVTGSGSKYFLV